MATTYVHQYSLTHTDQIQYGNTRGGRVSTDIRDSYRKVPATPNFRDHPRTPTRHVLQQPNFTWWSN